MNMNIDTQTQPIENTERSGDRRDDRRPPRADHRNARHLNRRASEVMQYLPIGWSATVVEPDMSGNQDMRTRLRVLVFENPDKGFKLLPFLTVRVPRRTKTDSGEVEVMDDMDILPNNPLEVALPAILFHHGSVLEEFFQMIGDYSKKQAELPPPNKRPLTQRPFAESLGKVARKNARERQQQEQEQEPEALVAESKELKESKGRKRSRKRKHDCPVALLMPLM